MCVCGVCVCGMCVCVCVCVVCVCARVCVCGVGVCMVYVHDVCGGDDCACVTKYRSHKRCSIIVIHTLTGLEKIQLGET